MHKSPSIPPATPEPYTGCPHCTAYEDERLLRRLRPLPSDAVLAVDPDDIDWNNVYWGYKYWGDNRSERRTIVRPLPRSLTDRIPLELFQHILAFLRWQDKDLYNCALVCSAWHRHSQRLLYSRVVIASRTAYDAVAHSALRNGRSSEYLTGTYALFVRRPGITPPGSREYFPAVSLVLGRSMRFLTCLEFSCSVRGPYQHSYIHSFSRFSALVHLKLSDFQLHSFFDLRTIICGLKTLRELDLFNGELVSRAPIPPSGYPPVKAPHLSKVMLGPLDGILFSHIAQWVTSTEICHGCSSLALWAHANDSLEQRRCAESISRKLGPSLDSMSYRPPGQDGWNPSAIASCTRLSTLELQVTANPIDSWQGLVTGFHEMLSHCSSPVMRTLKIDIYMNEDLKRGPPAPVHPDREFWTLNLGSIHDLMKQPLFNSLQDVRIRHWQDHVWYARLTCDAVLTAEEKERRLRLILEPWDKRGILTVKGYNELTDEELRRRRPGRHASNLNAKVGDPSAGAGGEEAQSPNDEIVLASGQEDKHGREGAV